MNQKVVLLLIAVCLDVPIAKSQDLQLFGTQTQTPIPLRLQVASASLSDQSHAAEEVPMPGPDVHANPTPKSSAANGNSGAAKGKNNTGKGKSGAASGKSAAGEKSESAAGGADAKLLDRGRVAFEASCTQCHEASRALEVTKSYDEWMKTIRVMAAKEDADIPVADYDAIARYLTATASGSGAKDSATDKADKKKEDDKSDKSSKEFDPSQVAAGRTAFNSSCLKCHDAERSTSKSKSYSEWLSTVRRMASKDGADISPSDFESIATYLASLSGGSGASREAAKEDSGGWTFGTSVSTVHRSASDESFVENPGFFADVWLTAAHQSSGAWGATVTACTSCHSTDSGSNSWSLELLEGSATVDVRKLLSKCDYDDGPQLSIKAGRFPVPFGAFSAMSNPSIYRTVTVPLMFNMGRRVFARGAAPPRQPVLPLPFADEGIDFMLRAPLTGRINFALDVFGVNGLQGDESVMFERSRSYTDNNEEPSFGLRTTVGGEYLRIGASLLHGGLQDQRSPLVDYTIWGGDLTGQLTDCWRIYAEFARRRQDSSVLIGTAEKTFGVIAETEYRLFKKPYFSMIMRYDTLEHRSQSLGDDHIQRLTSGFNLGLPGGSLLMINHEHWQPHAGKDVDLVGARWSVSF